MDALGWMLKSLGVDISQIDIPEVLNTVKTMAEKVSQFEATLARIERKLDNGRTGTIETPPRLLTNGSGSIERGAGSGDKLPGDDFPDRYSG